MMARRFLWLALLAPVTPSWAGAAEPGFTPRAAPTALVPAFTAIGPDVRALRLNPAGPFLPAPQLRGPLEPVKPPLPAAPPPAPVPAPAPVATLPTVVVSAALLRPMPAAPPVTVKAEKPAARSSAPPAPAVKKTTPRPATAPALTDFSAWEGICLLPEELPPQGGVARPGRRLRVLTDAFIRVAPDCGARILDVLETGEVVTVLGGGADGWYRARNPDWPEFWIGARLLAPTQQR